MLINREHRGWALGTAAATVVATAAYAWLQAGRPYGPSGGSWAGLAFGVLGTACMLLAGLLSARKKVRTARIGPAQWWMKAHIWLSLLAVPLILFHAGFRMGGPLTFWLMLLFAVVTTSGIVGLALQQFVPTLMTTRVPMEAPHSQVEHVAGRLAVDAYEVVAAVAGTIDEAAEERAWLEREAAEQASRPGNWKKADREEAAAEPGPGSTLLREVYVGHVRPYLRRGVASPPRGRPRRPPAVGALLAEAPEDWSPRIARLSALCEESRQLETQMRLHRLLHGWLFLHAPLAMAMFVLAAVHIWFALSYKMGG